MKEIQQRRIQSYIFAAILILLLLAVARLFAPFFTAILWSTLLYIIFSPLHYRFIKKLDFNTLKGKILRNFWAGVFTLGTLVLIIFPIFFAGRMFFQQAMDLGRLITDFLNERPDYISELFEKTAGFINDISPSQVTITPNDIDMQIRSLVNDLPHQALSLSKNVGKSVGNFSITMLIMMFSMFFFYVDGHYLAQLALKAIPIKKEYIKTLTKKFKDIIQNLVMGYILVALLQAVVAFIIFTIFGIKGSLVLSVLIFMLVFIPIVGATLIYIPIGIIMILGGRIAAGIIFLLVSIVFISGIDNILRPFFLRDRIQLHPLIIFFAILGGLYVFGFNGFILGPVLVILFLTVLDMFLTEHKMDKPENNKNDPSQGDLFQKEKE